MTDFSLETTAERIYDVRIQRYFKEVLGSYFNGYYRSAVVMLWSVLVTDMLFKLDQLANAYGDTTATSILAEIQTLRNNNPKSPEWESELLEKTARRTDLLNSAELSFLRAIQEHRHLSAHPVLDQIDALFSPNRETTRAHIRNALESVLTKPPIMSRRILDAFTEDIEALARLTPAREGFTRYLTSKYLNHFTPATATAVFRSLWRLVFRSNDARCEANRKANGVALSILMERWKNELVDAISQDRAWFSDISLERSQLREMIVFLSYYPNVFRLLTDAAKSPIQEYANESLDLFAMSSFLAESLDSHLDEIRRRIEDENNLDSLGEEAFNHICGMAKGTDAYSKALSIGITLYAQSSSFNTADHRYQTLIRPFLEEYSREHVESFLREGEENGQAWGRGRSSRDYREFKQVIDSRFNDLDLLPYPHFRSALTT
jgi:hypothetical protein